MKNILLLTAILLTTISCKAQVIGTLEQFEECSKRPNRDEGCPDLENITYVKDTNNRLDRFVGTWKGTYGGKQYEIKLEKKINYKRKPYNRMSFDMIIGRILVKSSSGAIIYNSMDKPDDNTYFWGDNFQYNAYMMSFVGNYDCLESGTVYVEVLPNTNQMTLYYYQDRDGWLDRQKCPDYENYDPVLPFDKMTLTKQ